MQIKDILLNEVSTYINKLKKAAKNHYPEAESDDEALLYWLARSVEHAEEDDLRQDSAIDQLRAKEALEFKQLIDKISDIEEILKGIKQGI